MLIDKLMLNPGADLYYNESFRNVLEDHMTFFRQHPTTVVLMVESWAAIKYEFDLFSLLRHYNVPEYLHWLTMRMNGMTAPTDATANITMLYVPDYSVVGRIAQSHQTTRKIT